jgi:hypothetical protein
MLASFGASYISFASDAFANGYDNACNKHALRNASLFLPMVNILVGTYIVFEEAGAVVGKHNRDRKLYGYNRR